MIFGDWFWIISLTHSQHQTEGLPVTAAGLNVQTFACLWKGTCLFLILDPDSILIVVVNGVDDLIHFRVAVSGYKAEFGGQG